MDYNVLVDRKSVLYILYPPNTVFYIVATKYIHCLQYLMPIWWHLASNLHLPFCFLTCFIFISTRLFHYFPENTLANVPQDLLTATFEGYVNSVTMYAVHLEFSFPCLPHLHAFQDSLPSSGSFLVFSLSLLPLSSQSSWSQSSDLFPPIPNPCLIFMLFSSSLHKALTILITPNLHFQLWYLPWAPVLYRYLPYLTGQPPST